MPKTLKVSKKFLDELRSDNRYEILKENQIGDDKFEIEFEYDPGEIGAGKGPQKLKERVEVTIPEKLLKGYLAKGFRIVSMEPSGKNVQAILER